MSDNKWHKFSAYGSLVAARYNAHSETLETQDEHGKICAYSGIPLQTWTELCQASLKESFFSEKIIPILITQKKKDAALKEWGNLLELAREVIQSAYENLDDPECNIKYLEASKLLEKAARIAKEATESDMDYAFCVCNYAVCLFYAGKAHEAYEKLKDLIDFYDSIVEDGREAKAGSDSDLHPDTDLIASMFENFERIEQYIAGRSPNVKRFKSFDFIPLFLWRM